MIMLTGNKSDLPPDIATSYREDGRPAPATGLQERRLSYFGVDEGEFEVRSRCHWIAYGDIVVR
jgi:hypothetical protein